MMQKRNLHIAVTGLNATDNPGPGLPVIRALRESRHFTVRIIGLCYDTLEPAIYLPQWVDKTYRLPLPTEGTEALLERLDYIHRQEHLDVIIPNFDSELFNFIRIAPLLKQRFNLRSFLPDETQFEARQKINLADFGRRHGVAVPKSIGLFSTADVDRLPEEMDFPFYVKGSFYEARLVYTAQQAMSAFLELSGRWGLPVIAQQRIQGNEVNVTALGDGQGNTIGAVPMRKQVITDKGKAWAGISIDDPALLELTRELVKSSRWRGGLELELVKTDQGKYYLLEINPRFPAWIYLAAACGQNHPEALVRMAMDETVSPFTTYTPGRLFVRYAFDQIVDLNTYENMIVRGEV